MPTLIRTARTTGLLYLTLAITGLVGFLLIRPRILGDDAEATLTNLVQQEALARVGIAVDMALVVSQALVAVWFYRLFHTADAFAAGCIAAFGLVNAIVVLVNAVLLAAALDVALTPVGEPAAAHLMYVVGNHVWTVANLFFGLWLIPMGWCVLRSGWMPRPLGWILMVGGVGYVVAPFVTYLIPQASAVAGALPYVATVGELWMVGYLLVRGVNQRAATTAPAQPADDLAVRAPA